MVEEKDDPTRANPKAEADRSENGEPAPAEQQPAEKKRDWYDIGNLIVLCLTFAAALAAAIFTGWLAIRTHDMANDSRDGLRANTRAWVVPTGARFDGDPKAGFNSRFKVTYENVGKEAASDVIVWANVGGISTVTVDAKKMPYIDVQTAPWPVNDSCKFDPSRFANRRTVYPSTKNEQITYGFNDPPYFPKDVFDGKKFFPIFGCIIYRSAVTGRTVHHSPYCLYLQPKRGEPIQNWTFEFCPSGSANAD